MATVDHIVPTTSQARPFADPLAEEAQQRRWTYIDLGGDIGILSSGAGLTMTIVDMITRRGGTAANVTAAAAPPKAVTANHVRLLRWASAMAPAIGETTAAINIDSEMPHAHTTGPHWSGETNWM